MTLSCIMQCHCPSPIYVFLRVRTAGGVWCGIVCTYIASAIIHGLNGQLCAVLLSLAVYTHVEHRLRCTLAKAFNACVLAKQCNTTPCDKHANGGQGSCYLCFTVYCGDILFC